MATQPVEAPSARSEVCTTSTGSAELTAVDQSLTSMETGAAANTGVSDTEDDQKFSEAANYRKTMGGVCSFMDWHQIPDFDSLSSSLDNGTPLLVPEPSLPGKYPSSYRLMPPVQKTREIEHHHCWRVQIQEC